jgi:hypothetical protein
MFSRNLYAGLDLPTLCGPINPIGNVFDTAFNETMDIEEWNDWMKWEGSAELEFLGAGFKQSFASNVSSLDTWSTNVETAGRNTTLSALHCTANEFALEDAPFEIDESTLSSNSLPAFPLNTLFSPEAQAPQTRQRFFHGFSTLTAAEEQNLQDIAMPYRMLSNIKIASEPSSPTVSHLSPSPPPEPESCTRKRLANKRKSCAEEDKVPTALSQSRKRGHNAIEKRYRTSLNEKINCLRDSIPELSRISGLELKTRDSEEDEESDGECTNSKTGQQKYGKAAILTRALEYIRYLETTTQRLGGKVDGLKTRVGAFEKLAITGSTILGRNGVSAISFPAIVKSGSLESIQAGTFTLKTSLQKYTLTSMSRLQTN